MKKNIIYPKYKHYSICCQCGVFRVDRVYGHPHKGYSERYDAHFCKQCKLWLEPACTSKTCDFCSRRPKTAKGVKNDGR